MSVNMTHCPDCGVPLEGCTCLRHFGGCGDCGQPWEHCECDYDGWNGDGLDEGGEDPDGAEWLDGVRLITETKAQPGWLSPEGLMYTAKHPESMWWLMHEALGAAIIRQVLKGEVRSDDGDAFVGIYRALYRAGWVRVDTVEIEVGEDVAKPTDAQVATLRAILELDDIDDFMRAAITSLLTPPHRIKDLRVPGIRGAVTVDLREQPEPTAPEGGDQ